MKNLRQKFSVLEVISFISGFALLAYELIAARLLAPTVGSSTYVWTSVIGVIIAALSVGYWAGGKLADSRQTWIDVAFLNLVSALAVAITAVYYLPILAWAAEVFEDSRLQAVVASLILFAPASFLLGMISPYLVKLRVTDLKTSGQSVASLSATNSIGGIVGTFVAGFILFGHIGSRESLVLVVVMLVTASWLIAPKVLVWHRLGLSALALVFALIPIRSNAIQIDTPSAHYEIHEGVIRDSDRMRLLTTGPRGAQSGVYIGQPDRLAFWYTEEIARLVGEINKKNSMLILGGGAFTLPQHLAAEYPGSTIDVVEIDPVLVDIAREHFYYRAPSNVNEIFNDARQYVNSTKSKYDIIIVDVYGDTSVPFSLLTREYGDQIARILNDDGHVLVNAIAGFSQQCKPLLLAIDQPYSRHYKNAYHSVDPSGGERTNMILMYSNLSNDLKGLEPFEMEQRVAYSDNFMPAERLHQACSRVDN